MNTILVEILKLYVNIFTILIAYGTIDSYIEYKHNYNVTDNDFRTKRKFLGLLNLQILPNPTKLLYDAVVYLKSYKTMGLHCAHKSLIQRIMENDFSVLICNNYQNIHHKLSFTVKMSIV